MFPRGGRSRHRCALLPWSPDVAGLTVGCVCWGQGTKQGDGALKRRVPGTLRPAGARHLYPTRREKCRQASRRWAWKLECRKLSPHSGQTWGGRFLCMRWCALKLQRLDSIMGQVGHTCRGGRRQVGEERPVPRYSS